METIHTAPARSSLPTSFSSRALATMDPAATTAAAAVTLGCFEANTRNSTEQRLYTKRN